MLSRSFNQAICASAFKAESTAFRRALRIDGRLHVVTITRAQAAGTRLVYVVVYDPATQKSVSFSLEGEDLRSLIEGLAGHTMSEGTLRPLVRDRNI